MPNKIKSSQEKIYLELEKSRIKREKAHIVLNMGLVLYFGFLIAGMIGFVFGYIEGFLLNVLIVCGIVILIVSTVPYHVISHKEEKWISSRLDETIK
ncbi:hypothetical protein KY358_04640 [Candidatus Woesearchaeota archaeon]|nr:hypothetical protein [Candidatus Woesearchaeota archaeon]